MYDEPAVTDDDVTGFVGSLLETIGDAVVVVGRAGDIVYVNRRAEELLGLDPQARELSLVCGAVTGDGREVAMRTRSMLGILGEVSTFVEVPAAHVAEGRARAAAPLTGTELPIRINSGPSQPADSYAPSRTATTGSGSTTPTSGPSGCSRS